MDSLRDFFHLMLYNPLFLPVVIILLIIFVALMLAPLFRTWDTSDGKDTDEDKDDDENKG